MKIMGKELDAHKLKDYATTVALAAIPVIITYQEQIGQFVPVEYALIFTIGMGVISQLAGDKRVKAATETLSTDVDKAQAEAQKYLDEIARLNQVIDEKQAEIKTVTGLVEMTSA